MNLRAPRSLLALLSAALLVTACGGGGDLAPEPIVDPASFSYGFDHPYFPVEPGMVRRYEGQSEGQPRVEVVHTLAERRDIVGVECAQFHQEVFLEGALSELTTEYYAADRDGNVWMFGEESWTAIDGVLVMDEDSWLVGEGDGIPWMAFPRNPTLGDVYVGYRPGGEDTFIVESLTETATVPAGVFSNCMQMVENPDDPEDTDIILYARGVGRVQEDNAGGRTELVEVQPGTTEEPTEVK